MYVVGACDLCGMSTIYVSIYGTHGVCACAVWVMWYIFNVCIVYMLGMYIMCVCCLHVVCMWYVCHESLLHE